MGLISILLGLGKAAGGANIKEAAEVLLGNRAEEARLENKEFSEVMDEFGKEFGIARTGWFDRFVDALNRLPRPVLAMGTLGLFAFSMIAPGQFALRMEGLSLVPDPLWWLMGAIVSFYFGARELHYRRENFSVDRLRRAAEQIGEGADVGVDSGSVGPVATEAAPATTGKRSGNAAFDEWKAARAG